MDPLEQAATAHPFIAANRFTATGIYAGSHIGWRLGLQTLPPRKDF
ncbi:MAG: hypothetical protein ACRYHQ_00105 [Janthinobacterium lividum]